MCNKDRSSAKLSTGIAGNDLELMNDITAAPAQTIVKPGFIALLIAVSAVSPLGINMYLPSMPGMARALGVDFTNIQLTLSLFKGAIDGGNRL